MIIAPGVKIEDWKKLDLSSSDFNQEWDKAINVFEKRIRERYLEPVRILVESEKDMQAVNRRFGFSIMAILCLLAETLQCFIEGKDESDGSKKVFTTFLLENEPFKGRFKGDKELAEQFYKHIRCGILHQAEITGGAKLWSVGPTICVMDGQMTINRNKFYSGMLKMFETYLESLRKGDLQGQRLRENLKTKMGYIINNATSK